MYIDHVVSMPSFVEAGTDNGGTIDRDGVCGVYCFWPGAARK
jgi:hypothetical protein